MISKFRTVIETKAFKPAATSWIWDNPSNLSSKQKSKFITSAKKLGVGALYINISDYLDIFETTSEKELQEASFTKSLAEFVKLANDQQIEVYVVLGNTNWSKSSHWYLPEEALNFIQKYNNKYADYQITRVQFDIEFYSEKNFDFKNIEAFTEYLELIERLALKSSIPISVAIPAWFEQESVVTKLKFHNEDKTPFEHLVDILNKSDKPHLITVMAYRNTAQGILDFIHDEVNLIKDTQVKMEIAIETAGGLEKNITYDTVGKEKLYEDYAILYEDLSKYANFTGIAVHDLPSLISLTQK